MKKTLLFKQTDVFKHLPGSVSYTIMCIWPEGYHGRSVLNNCEESKLIKTETI